MAISVALVKSGEEISLVVGTWETREEAEEMLDTPDEPVLALEKFEGRKDSANMEILEAMMGSAGRKDALGRDLEELLNFAFRLGQKAAR